MCQSLLKKISQLPALSKIEAVIAAYIESHYPHSSLQSIQQISEGCGVSSASVSRFIKKLGYENFTQYRKAAQDDISLRLQSPIKRYKSKLNEDSGGFKSHFRNCIANLEETMLRLTEADFTAVVEALVGAKTLYVAGGASAQVMAKYFTLLSSYIRKQVKCLSPDISTIAHNLSDMQSGDVLLLISQQRSSSVTTKLAALFKAKGCQVVLLSDKQSSPIMPFTTHALVVHSDSDSLFNSRVAMLTLLESLINAMIPFYQCEVEERFALMEEIFDLFGVYSK